MFALQKTIGSARLARQLMQHSSLVHTVVSTPPTVKVSLAEQFFGGALLLVSFLGIPTYIAVNIKNYRSE